MNRPLLAAALLAPLLAALAACSSSHAGAGVGGGSGGDGGGADDGGGAGGGADDGGGALDAGLDASTPPLECSGQAIQCGHLFADECATAPLCSAGGSDDCAGDYVDCALLDRVTCEAQPGCQPDCLPGATLCLDDCVDLETDEAHCGGCGQSCGEGALCVDGACACAGDESAACGACENVCELGEGCVGGICTETDQTPIWVFGRLVVPSLRAGVIEGFDLDDHVTATTADPIGCHRRDRVNPAGVPGIDNELAAMAPTLDVALGDFGLPTLQESLDDFVQSGDFLYGVRLTTEPDETLKATLYHVRAEDGSPDYTGHTLDEGQTYETVGAPIAETTGIPADAERVTIAGFSFNLAFGGGFTLPIEEARFTLEVGTDSGRGVLGGLGDPSDFVEAYPAIVAVVKRDADLPGGECTGLSAGLLIEASSGFLAP